MLVPTILCGGSGSRLWPMSRKAYPKQYLDLMGSGHSMLQSTVARLKGIPQLGQPLAICNHEHRFLVAEQLQHCAELIGSEASSASIILEPVARNTAPAVAVAALSALEQDADAIMLVLPADHSIRNETAFQKALVTARAAAEDDFLVTFGVVPNKAETGYGYIEQGSAIESTGSFGISRFAEKPDAETAERYFASGNFLWNSGMFVFRAQRYLEELDRFAPEMLVASKAAYASAYTDLDFKRLDQESFERCPSDSIDYAVMEKTDKGAVVPLDAGWSDVGSWSGLWELGDPDASGNVLRGDVMTELVSDSYVHSDSRLVAAVGLKNTVIVETADAVLVADMDFAQDVKKVVSRLQAVQRDEGETQKVVYRPWGSYESICGGERFQVKKIVVNPGQKLSLQMHHHRAEHWIVVKGTARVTCEEEVFTLKEDQSTYIPLGHKHRLENQGKIPLELIEVQSGSYLGEDDIVRYDDVYGRES